MENPAALSSLPPQQISFPVNKARLGYDRDRNIPALLIYRSLDSLTKLGIPQRIHDLLPHSDLHFIAGEEHFPHEGAPEGKNRILMLPERLLHQLGNY